MDSPNPKNPGGLVQDDSYYRQLFELSPDSILVTLLPEGTILDMNSRFLEKMGYTSEELIGRNPLALGFWVNPEHRETLIARLREGRGVCSGLETLMRTKQGTVYTVSISARVLEMQGKKVLLTLAREDSERHAIRKALRESEQRFEEMVKFLPVIVYETDLEGHLTFANRHAFSFFGYSQEDFEKGLNVLAMVSPEDQERASENFQRTLRGEKTGDLDYGVLKKDGSRFQALIAAAPILREGRPTGIRGVINDISGLRQTEKKLRDSEEKYRMVVELSDDGIVWTQGDRHMFANRKMAEIFGYDASEDMLGRSVIELVHPDDLERVMRIHNDRLQGREAPARYEYKGIRQDGKTVYIEVSAIRTFYQGEWGSLAFLRDITERKRVEKEMQESRELYRTLVEMSNDAITMVKGDLHVYVNPKMVEIFGYEQADEIVGRSMIQTVHPDDRDRVLEINRKRQRGEPVPDKYVFKGIRKDGQPIFLETSAKRLEYRGENVSLVFLRDITARIQAEEELKASEEKYRMLVEHANEAIFVAQEGFLKLSNPKTLEITGYDRETLRNMPFTELIHPDDRGMVVDRHLRRVRGEDLPAVYEFRIVDREGHIKWVDINSVRIDWEGRPATLNFLSDITERINVDLALRESEERARLIFDTVPDSITITRVADGRYLAVNDYFCQLTGYSQEETIGRTVNDLNVFVNPEDRECFIHEMQVKGEVTNFEIQYRRKDGSLFTTLLSARPIRYAGEDCLVAVVADITGRKAIEDALRQSEEKHRKLVEAMREGFGVMNERNEVTFINKRFLDLMGYRPEEMFGRPVADFVDPENRRVLQEQGKRRRKGESAPYEVAWTRKDGQKIYTLMAPEPVFDEQGNFRGSFAVITDISERKHMEEALRKSEERYRLLVENANEAILVIQEGLIRFANPKAVKIMQFEGQDLSPRPFLDFVHPEDRETVFQRYQERLSGISTPASYSFRLIDREGRTIWVEINAVRIAWEGGPAALVFLTDVTEKKHLEMQFLQAQKMEAIGRLAGGVAHDFNNLLTSIVGHADLMLMELRQDDPLVSDIREIKKAADRATDLTRQLLAFSRKQILQPRILNLNQTIGDMKKMLRRMIGEDIELETNLSPALGRVLVDPGQIEQVIMNLVVNARDALPRGGRLTIETSHAEIGEAELLKYVGSKPGYYVLLEVRDNGLGMSQEIQTHIFEPFFTTKELGKGTGLGLSTVYGIVKQSNGYIWVESEPGQGTSFKIYLPRVEGEAQPGIRPEKTVPSYRGTETILLVEDNDLVRQLARSVLEQYGYNVLEARTGEEGYRLSKGYGGKIHLLLTDVVMPGISGQTLAEQVNLLRPKTKVLFMSGYSEEATLQQSGLGRELPFLQKPFSPNELGKMVRELLDKEDDRQP